MGQHDHIVVVGASLAGSTVADTLRRRGFTGSLTLIGAEPRSAYNRPALSKGVLAGYDGFDEIALPPLSCEVDQLIGIAAVALDTQRREVVLADGERIRYDKLAITTGARARRLADLDAADTGVQEITFRDLDDAQRLSWLLAARPRTVIVGAGILGMELASACVDRGASVTVIDRQPPLHAQVGPFLAELVVKAAERRGVHFVHAPDGLRLRGRTSGTPIVELADGRRLEGDLVLSAVGCLPEVDWLRTSGLAGPGGLHIDTRCRVTPDIVAAGDVAAFPSTDGPRRTPLWTAAFEQARTAATTLLDGDSAPPLTPSPYFWTEQFGMTIRMCGAMPPLDKPTVLEGMVRNGVIEEGGLLLRWNGASGTAAAVNRRIPITKLCALTRPAPATI
ncbi:FAD-dependent oxidoreductase [Amycolatopsis sp. NPDC051061]|uniref:NAD(P)/FAD-dependent oxidoreductase n=1 Tax=Amycolatopsis sp. NPDC051061 TaxID=3155042 RepID=UPI003412606E